MAVEVRGAEVGLSHGPGVFTDEEFEKVAREVVAPDLNGFEFFVESHGTKFFRKYKEVSRCCVLVVARLALAGLEVYSLT